VLAHKILTSRDVLLVSTSRFQLSRPSRDVQSTLSDKLLNVSVSSRFWPDRSSSSCLWSRSVSSRRDYVQARRA